MKYTTVSWILKRTVSLRADPDGIVRGWEPVWRRTQRRGQLISLGWEHFAMPTPCGLPGRLAIDSTHDKAKATPQKNIREARQSIKESGQDPDTVDFVVDCDASVRQTKHVHDFSPCITRSRNKGHWLTHKNRRMNIKEVMRLQGIDPEHFKQVVSDTR